MVTITKTASNKYFVSFSCEEEVNFKPRTKREVGTDVGIKDVIVTSDNNGTKLTISHIRDNASCL
jgi:putative transposase